MVSYSLLGSVIDWTPSDWALILLAATTAWKFGRRVLHHLATIAGSIGAVPLHTEQLRDHETRITGVETIVKDHETRLPPKPPPPGVSETVAVVSVTRAPTKANP